MNLKILSLPYLLLYYFLYDCPSFSVSPILARFTIEDVIAEGTCTKATLYNLTTMELTEPKMGHFIMVKFVFITKQFL